MSDTLLIVRRVSINWLAFPDGSRISWFHLCSKFIEVRYNNITNFHLGLMILCLCWFAVLQTFYIVGNNKDRSCWRVLKINRLVPSELSIHEDPRIYSENECHDMLTQIHEENIATDGLRFVTKCYGIAGLCNLKFFSYLNKKWSLLQPHSSPKYSQIV